MKPTRCACLDDPERKTLPMAAATRFLLGLVEQEGPKSVGGPKAVEMLRKHPNAAWCLSCGGIRDDD